VLGSDTLVTVVNSIYMYGHWPVIIAAGALLYRYRRPHYTTLRNACLLTGLVGLLIFATFPVAPPRLAGLPLLDTVTRGAGEYRQIVPASLVNQYAAMPSLHVGWNLLVGIVAFRASRSRLVRLAAVAMPAAMAFAVVATANHFVLDAVAGSILVVAGLRVVDAHAARRHQPRPTLDRGDPHERPGRAARA
jgi:hypothetical protein